MRQDDPLGLYVQNVLSLHPFFDLDDPQDLEAYTELLRSAVQNDRNFNNLPPLIKNRRFSDNSRGCGAPGVNG